MHNHIVELQGKCRRLFYARIDGPSMVDETGAVIPGEFQRSAGDVLGVAAGGGAVEELTGDDLIIATFNDDTAPTRIGCIEEFFNPLPATTPLRIDLSRVQECRDAVDAHRAAVKAEADFVFETGIKLFGGEQPTTKALRHLLKVQEMHTRDNLERTPDHATIVRAQTDLEALCKICDDCCEQLLVTRDAAITFAEQAS